MESWIGYDATETEEGGERFFFVKPFDCFKVQFLYRAAKQVII